MVLMRAGEDATFCLSRKAEHSTVLEKVGVSYVGWLFTLWSMKQLQGFFSFCYPITESQVYFALSL